MVRPGGKLGEAFARRALGQHWSKREQIVMEIRIVAVPPGEAPVWVRQCWVGMILPLAAGENGPRRVATWGVLSRPRTLVGRLWRLLTGQHNWEYGYVVEAPEALRILAVEAPEAARWWAENTCNRRPGRRFVFSASVCEEV